VAQVSDFMPVKGTTQTWRNSIIRMIEGVRGDLKMKMQVRIIVPIAIFIALLQKFRQYVLDFGNGMTFFFC
jgi:hypothetical protein